MNHKTPVSKKINVISFIIFTSLAIMGCSTLGITTLQKKDGTIPICHAISDGDTPYEAITLDFKALNTHRDHPDDLIPAPATGCPDTIVPDTNDGKITICHATNSATNPYNEITIAFSGLDGHAQHSGDLIPVPESGCPSSRETPTPTIPYEDVTLTPTVSPTGTMTETPTVTTIPEETQTSDEKVTICHATGSAKNPYVMITISKNGLNGHDKHSRDIIPAPAGGCPKK